MKERIHKLLAAAGVASRRAVEQMILDGRIAVNGQVARTLPVLVDPARDKVCVDGEAVKLRPGGRRQETAGGPAGEKLVYLLMYKPKGVVSTNVAQGEQIRAIDLLPKGFRTRVYPVGRLDAESKGLLLLTNDGELTNILTHPRHGIPKTYRALVEGRVTPQTVAAFEKGMWLADREGRGFKTGKSNITILHRQPQRTSLEIVIGDGRNPQVRRVLHKLGHKVRDLVRTSIGPLSLKGMSPGEIRALSEKEVRLLKKAVRGNPKPRASHDAPGPKPE